jgi:integrase
LTELKIRNSLPKDKRYKLFDGDGLYLEVLPSGAKSWRTLVRADGKESRPTLGRWPETSLKRARELSRELKLKPPDEAPSRTFGALSREWLAKFGDAVTPKERRRKVFLLERNILPAIGDSAVSDLNAVMLLERVFKPCEATGHYETLKRLKTLVSQVLRYGVAGGEVESDFTSDLRGALKSPVAMHRATILDKAKIGRLLDDIRHYTGTPSVSYALRILPYVFVRPGELRNAEWSEFDFGERLWRIPAEKMKMRSRHLVPLSDQVLASLEELREFTGDGKYLFPGPRTRVKPITDMAVNAALRYLGYGGDEICGHGFRAMASTLLNEMGNNSDWIERQLAHSERSGVRAAYNHAEWLPERRKMMQDWADFLDGLMAAARTARGSR